jgi:hypothetical protein
LRDIKRCCTEGTARRTVDHELEGNIVTRQIEQVFCVKDRRKFPRDDRRIFRAEAECDQGADVRKHCMPDIGFQLMQVLVREDEPDPRMLSARLAPVIPKWARGSLAER